MRATIKAPAQAVLYNNMGKNAEGALAVDEIVKYIKKADWRGNSQKENEIKGAIYGVVNDHQEVERIFSIVKQQNEY